MKSTTEIRRDQHSLETFAERHKPHGCHDGTVAHALDSFARWVLDEPEDLIENILANIRQENEAVAESN